MPCRTEPWDEPNKFQEANHEAARLYRLLAEKMKMPVTDVPDKVIKAAKNRYTNLEITPLLCGLIKSLNAKQLEKFIYNGRDKVCRQLADWWDEHQLQDAKRILEEKKAAKEKRLAKQAKTKLTKQEYKALIKFIGK